MVAIGRKADIEQSRTNLPRPAVAGPPTSAAVAPDSRRGVRQSQVDRPAAGARSREMASVEHAAGFAEVVESIAEIGQGRTVVFVANKSRRGNAVVVLIFTVHAEHVGIGEVASGGDVGTNPDADLIALASVRPDLIWPRDGGRAARIAVVVPLSRRIARWLGGDSRDSATLHRLWKIVNLPNRNPIKTGLTCTIIKSAPDMIAS